jgi:hypothetical protein
MKSTEKQGATETFVATTLREGHFVQIIAPNQEYYKNSNLLAAF